MSAHLKTLADASLELEAADAAVDESAWQTATEAFDRAALALDDLRSAWPGFSAPERAVVGPSAAALKRRIELGRARVPRHTALSVGTAVSDPEEDEAPH